MRRRAFLAAAAGAAACARAADSSLGTLMWMAPDGAWRRPLPDGPPVRIGPGRLHHASQPYRAGIPSPDGRLDARVEIRRRKPGPRGETQATAELLVSAAGGKPRVLLSNEGDIRLYGWTRDAQTILYWRAPEWSASFWADGVDLYAIPASGGAERPLGVKTLAHGDVLDLAPQGNLLAATRCIGRETWSDQQIVVVHVDSGSVRELTPGSMAALCPAWSPDSTTIACHAAPSLIGRQDPREVLQKRRIWLLDPHGAAPARQVTNDPRYRDEEPMWAADGSHLLFGRMNTAGRPSLWLMARDGSGARHVCDLEITGPSGKADTWFGFYGYIDWRSACDWRR